MLMLILLVMTLDGAPSASRRLHGRVGVRSADRAGSRAGDARRGAP
jgi:hypothetical protein